GRQVGGDVVPLAAVVGGLEDVGLPVVVAVAVDGEVGGRLVEVRTLDAADPALRGQAGEAVGNVGPVRPALAADVDAAVVGAHVQNAVLQGRFGDGGDGLAGAGAGTGLAECQVGADDLPSVAAVDGAEQVVAADVDRAR